MPPINFVDHREGSCSSGIGDRLHHRCALDSSGYRGEVKFAPSRTRIATGDHQVTTALLLAAGVGARLKPRTNRYPKCLTEVCGTTILGRLVSCLVEQGFKRLVVVVGHRGDQIREYLKSHASGLQIHYIQCDDYATTNNIYSLWLAKEHIHEPFVLIESDLVFDSRLLGLLRVSNRIAVGSFRSSMDGTTVSFDDSGRVEAFVVGSVNGFRHAYKTVNLYSLSVPLWQEVGRRLEQRIASGRVHDYYEVVFAELALEGLLPFQAVHFDDGRWCEIDTPDDLIAAEQLFSELERTTKRYMLNGSCHVDRT